MKLQILFKKIFLIFCGLILSLFLLEFFLQSTSFVIKHIKDYKTHNKYKKIKTKDSIIILCIGESTTSRQYPVQLQQLLNNIRPGKFYVIDSGLSGITLETISEEIESNIKKYNPDIMLFMMGINNGFYSSKENKNMSISDINTTKIKSYKLALLLKMHIMSLIKTKPFETNIVPNTDITDDLEQQIAFLQKYGKFNEAVQLLETTLKKKSDNEYAYSKLVQIYSDFLPDDCSKNKGYEMAIKGLDMNFIKEPYIYLIYETILKHNLRNKNYKLLKFYTDKIINESIDTFKTDEAYLIYGFIKDILSVEQKKLIFSVMLESDKTDQSYGTMAIENLRQGNYEKTEEYFKMAEELRLNFPNKKTYQLYKLILQKTVNLNTKIICMQYPVRSIESLKNMLKNEDYYNKIIFVSNEIIFKQMLKKYPYTDIFIDQFAGDFGHCTTLGNQLIAENVAKTIIDLTK